MRNTSIRYFCAMWQKFVLVFCFLTKTECMDYLEKKKNMIIELFVYLQRVKVK